MAVTMAVFLNASKMPTPARWAEAIRSDGFNMEMDPEFDVRTFSGFLPCKYEGKEAGFVYYWNDGELQLQPEVQSKIGMRTVMITLNTHSRTHDLMTSTIASAVLCALADGVLWDTESNEFISSNDAVKWGKTREVEIKARL